MDSKLINFMATPGELVNISRPGHGKLSGPPVIVNIVNNASGTEISQSESTGPSGARQIDVVIDEIVAKGLRRTGSASNQAIRSLGGSTPLIARG